MEGVLACDEDMECSDAVIDRMEGVLVCDEDMECSDAVID